MGQITLFGHSDDNFEIEGDIVEEIGCYGMAEEGFHVAVSDGHLLSVRYGEKDACWRIALVTKGTSQMSKSEGCEDGEYSDRVTLTGDNLRWVVVGQHLARAAAKGAR